MDSVNNTKGYEAATINKDLLWFCLLTSFRTLAYLSIADGEKEAS